MQRQVSIFALLLCLALVLAACGGAASPTSTGGSATSAPAGDGMGKGGNTTVLPTAEAAAAPTATAAAAAGEEAAATAPAALSRTNSGAMSTSTPIMIIDEGVDAGSSFDTSTSHDRTENSPPGGVVEQEEEPIEPPAATVGPAATTVADQDASPLKAGEVDDNADFSAYQGYLGSYSGPPALEVDVTERHMLTITNDQQRPVLDAIVKVFDGDRQVFEGRTYAGGKMLIMPRALGIAPGTALRVVVEKDGQRVEGALARGGEATSSQSFVLTGARALPDQPRLDVLFLLDATGSMSDEIEQIQRTIVSIAQRVAELSPRPELRLGLVAYRDRGEDYVTRIYDFTSDVGAFRQTLLSVNAAGGGDEPEALSEALHAAVQGVQWSPEAVRLIFLVADAPPHLDYENDYSYVHEASAAVARGVKIYPIAASNTNEQAEFVFRQLAQQTLASFIFLTYQSGQPAGPPGDSTVHNVDPSQYTVERLDDLVVQVVERELARAQGR